MKKNKKGFVVSAVLYPLLVLFLAIIMGLLSMTDTRKRILDKMKLEITDNIFDDAACSCDTILAKLNYIIANGTGGSGGDTGSYAYNKLTLNVKTYEAYSDFPVVGNIIGDIAVLSDTPIKNYYVSTSVPKSPQEGTVWIVQDNTSNYYVTSDWNRIGISYVMQYENSKWVLKKSYVYNGESWTMLYYVNLKNNYVDLTKSDINAEITKTYDYTGEYQTFKAVFSGYYKIELWGAQGGSYSSSVVGGLGSYTSGEIYLDAGEILYVYIGGQGKNPSGLGPDYTGGTGGWNGGGDGIRNAGNNANIAAEGGGGATDIRLIGTSDKKNWDEFDSLKTRIMVAAGGSGSANYSNGVTNGTAGGGLNGYEGMCDGGACSTTLESKYGGIGATQTLAGYSPYSKISTMGGFGYAGSGAKSNYDATGGGGGYYGGGGAFAGGNGRTIGGSGSSYISGFNGCNSIKEESSADNIIHTGSAYHYSGKYFLNSIMVDGKGSSWGEAYATATKNQPTYDGKSTQIGNSGNGYAKITLETVEVISKSDIEKKQTEVENKWIYNYSGTYQEFTAPTSGYYKAELWGAQGGSYSSSVIGGYGSYTTGDIYLNKNEKLYIYVGGQGTNPLGLGTDYSGGTGGWNGGGDGLRNSGNTANKAAEGGGGATDIRLVSTSSLGNWLDFESLKSRIMVAAGGSGSAYYADAATNGSAGGGINGYDGMCDGGACSASSELNYGGIGATQALAGYSPVSKTSTIGGFGYAGSGTPSNYDATGGGGGYYGGGGAFAGSNGRTIGSTGSSYISGFNGCNSIAEESTSTNILHTGSAYHYSGYYFKSGVMIDGKGQSWNEAYAKTSPLQPNHDNSGSMTGNSGHGYAKITKISTEEKSSEEISSYEEKNNSIYVYNYSSTYQTFIASKSGYYKIELWGAQGGNYNTNVIGGKGAYTYGKIYLAKGQKLYVYVGGQGENPRGLGTNYSGGSGGWNGGGDGMRNSGNSNNKFAGGGGGATDIRLEVTSSLSSWSDFNSIKSRIMTASGGSGAAYYVDAATNGTAGGGLTGYEGMCDGGSCTYSSDLRYSGLGATQTLAGYSQVSQTATNGGFGYGGSGSQSNYDATGGGSGYYGGGGAFAGSNGRTTGGSGSSYISGFAGCNSIAGESTASNLLHTGSAYHYSGYYFTDAIMIDGKGYKWQSGKALSAINQPTYDGTSTMVGNSGNGYARIEFIEAANVSEETLNNDKLNAEKNWNFTYSKSYQEFTVPKTGTYKIELWGAQGGSYTTSVIGGLGSYTSGQISLTKGTKLYVYVGSQGTNPLGLGDTYSGGTGGWNGGGDGIRNTTTSSDKSANGGGGSTDIRTIKTSSLSTWNTRNSIISRIMVAAGGSGSAYYADAATNGSAGGGLKGYNGYCDAAECTTSGGSGGTQIAAGSASYNATATSLTKGDFGYGGNGAKSNYNATGGGSGWYGGGGAYSTGNGRTTGGSGSSYISGFAGCIGVNSSGNPLVTKYSKLEDSISNTGYKFTNSIMIDGKGYSWNQTSAVSVVKQPTPDGTSTQTGQSGNGYAKITYLGA